MPTIRRPRTRNAPEHGSSSDPIGNLILSGRGHHGLVAALFNTGIADAEDMTIAAGMTVGDDDIMRTPNVGRPTVRDIRSEIDRYLQRGRT